MGGIINFVKSVERDNLLLSIILLALLLRLINLDQSFWLDEGAQAVQSVKPVAEIWHLEEDFHPPLHYYLVHFWMKGGMREWYLRLSSVFTGVATVWLVFLIGKELDKLYVKLKKVTPPNLPLARGGIPLGYLAAGLMAIAPYHIYYSQELRMYALSVFWASLLVYALLTGKWWLHLLALVGGLYTYYLFGLMVVAELVWIFLKSRIALKKWLVNVGAAIVLFLPWVPVLRQQLELGARLPDMLPGWSGLSSPGTWKALPLTYVKFVLGRIDFDNNYLYAGIVGLSLVFVVPLLWRSFRASFTRLPVNLNARRSKLQGSSQEGVAVFLIWLWLIVPVILAWVISFWVPLNGPWRLLFVLPAFYILLAVGIEKFKGRKMHVLTGGLILISLFGLMTYYLNPRFYREDWRGAVMFVGEKVELSAESSTLVTFAWPEPFAPYRWYASDLDNALGLAKNLKVSDKDKNEIAEILQFQNAIFHFEYLSDLSDPERLIPRWIEEAGFLRKQIYDFQGVGFVYQYQKLNIEDQK